MEWTGQAAGGRRGEARRDDERPRLSVAWSGLVWSGLLHFAGKQAGRPKRKQTICPAIPQHYPRPLGWVIRRACIKHARGGVTSHLVASSPNE